MGAKEILEQRIPEKAKANPEVQQSINGQVVFDLTGDDGGQWTLDLTTPEGNVSAGAIDNPKVTLTMTTSDFEEMVMGGLDAQRAFLTGKLKVKGDMGAALKLGKLLS